MSSTTLDLLINNTINNSTIILRTSLNLIIEAIIKNYIEKNTSNLSSNTTLINYLKTLRLNYYFIKLEENNSTLYTNTLSKYYLF